MVLCEYCGNSYASSGGLTRHYRICSERKSFYHLEELKLLQPIITINNYTMNVYQNDDKLFDSFKTRLLGELCKFQIDGYESAVGALRTIKDSIKDPNDKQIKIWLNDQVIIREEVDGVDGQELVDHTTKCINSIEDEAMNFIKGKMRMMEFLKFKNYVYNNGLLS